LRTATFIKISEKSIAFSQLQEKKVTAQ